MLRGRGGGDTRYWNLTVAVRLLLKRLRYVHCEILRLFCYQLHSLLLLFNTWALVFDDLIVHRSGTVVVLRMYTHTHMKISTIESLAPLDKATIFMCWVCNGGNGKWTAAGLPKNVLTCFGFLQKRNAIQHCAKVNRQVKCRRPICGNPDCILPLIPMSSLFHLLHLP